MARWAKGKSANPGGRPKEVADIKRLARQYTPEAVKALRQALKRNEHAVAAATLLLAYGYGKPASTINVRQITDLADLTEDELRAIAGDTGPTIDAAAADERVRATLKAGLAQLGEDFAARAEPARVDALRAVEHSEFFGFVRAKTLGTLYASPIAYAHFGYEGEAFSKGGYLTRGFDELNWLPDVPLEDSGPKVGAAGR